MRRCRRFVVSADEYLYFLTAREESNEQCGCGISTSCNL